jgi:hypothetical protein
MKPAPKTGKCGLCGRRGPVASLTRIGQGAMARRLCMGCRTGFLSFTMPGLRREPFNRSM